MRLLMGPVRAVYLGVATLLAGIGVTGAGPAVPASAASAAAHAQTWSVQALAPVPDPSGELDDVSCTSGSACVAVGAALGAGVLAEAWNGQHWRLQPTQGDGILAGVSCVSADFCVAVGTSAALGATTLIETWDGTRWSVVPSHAYNNGELDAVSCASATACLAVGSFGLLATMPLAEWWNGTRWSRVIVPDAGTSAGLGSVSCSSATACTAVGGRGRHGATIPLIERWNGSTFTPQASAVPPGDNSSLLAVSCPQATGCVAVGGDALGQQPFAEVWRGTGWSDAAPLPVTGTLSSVSCTSPGTCMVAGQAVGQDGQSIPLAVRWNGGRWAVQTIPVPRGASDPAFAGIACAPASGCLAVGRYTSQGQSEVALGESWDGTGWAIQPVLNRQARPQASLASVSCAGPAACLAVGGYTTDTNAHLMLSEDWNGTRWALNSPPKFTGGLSPQLQGVSCGSPAMCVAVGRYVPSGAGEESLPFAEVWNGTRWSVTLPPSPSAMPGFSELDGVSCVSAAECIAVGRYQHTSPKHGTSDRPLAYRWNGTGWARLHMPYVASGYLSAVSCTADVSCIAVGAGPEGMLAERWHGGTWAILPNPATPAPSVDAVSCSSPAACTAVGEGGPGLAAERWDGTSWTAQQPAQLTLGQSPQFDGVSCATDTACTAVGGFFTGSESGGIIIQTWNGHTWRNQTAPEPGGNHADDGLGAVTCSTPSVCTAVGDQFRPGLPLAERSG